MPSSSHHLEEISIKSTSTENPLRHRHNKENDTEVRDDDQKSVEKEEKIDIKKKATVYLMNFYAYQRQLIALPIWNWLTQRFPVADNHNGTKANPVFILQRVTRYFNNQLSKNNKEDEKKKKTLSLDEADLIVVIIWIEITPCLVILFACTNFVKNACLITGTWIYPTLLTYAHLEQHSYPKVGYFIVAWVLFSFSLLLEQYYLQVIQYTPSNFKSNYPLLFVPLDSQDNLSFTYILIKIIVIYILLNPRWELIIPLIRSITLHAGKCKQIMGIDWEQNLYNRHLLQEKMIKQSFPVDNDIGETKIDNVAESTDKQIDEISSATNSGYIVSESSPVQSETSDDVDNEGAGDEKTDEITGTSKTTPGQGETSENIDNEDAGHKKTDVMPVTSEKTLVEGKACDNSDNEGTGDKRIDVVTGTSKTIPVGDKASDHSDNEGTGDKKTDEIIGASKTTPEQGETSDENDDDEDNFSYVHVEGTAKQMEESVQKEAQNIPTTILCDEQKSNDIERTVPEKKGRNASGQVSKEHM